MSSSSRIRKRVIEYFQVQNDASLVTWAHAVNSKQSLKQSLNSNLMFLEADIMLIEEKHSEPIMAHPPQTDGDLTFRQWLNMSKTSGKGLKLDFKTESAVEPCLHYLDSIKDELENTPIILNADVIQSGKASPIAKIDFGRFVRTCIDVYPRGILSLGWTTTDSSNSRYSWRDVSTMHRLLHQLKVVNETEITFPVRAMWTCKSLSLFRLFWLIETIELSTLTVWSHATDIFALESILLLRKYFPKDKVFFDLPALQDDYFKTNIDKLETQLSASNDPDVMRIMNRKAFARYQWTRWHGVIYESDHASYMVGNGASFISRTMYKASSLEIYELYGRFEIVPLNNEQIQQELPINLMSDVNSNEIGKACVRVSLRSTNTSMSIASQPSMEQLINASVYYHHTPGSIHVYLFTNGLVRVYVGNRLEQEANLHPLSVAYEYSITDVGEAKAIVINVKSQDAEMNSFTLQLLVTANYASEQLFYVSQTLLVLGDDYGVGVDALCIADEISDPQDRENVENQNN